MYKIDYTDEQWRAEILALNLDDWLRDWSMVQVDRTQDYYISRIAQLGMQGERVLDAGCGMGNWSMGLARHYQRVDAIEIDRARLAVLKAVCPHFNGRIVPEVGSVHELPYPDASFDGVFCNGVLFVTDYRKTLAEFRRVLKPGGQLYVTYCGIEWWRHLMLERGAREPDCVTYGANGLLHYLWCLMDKLAFCSGANAQRHGQLLDAIWAMVTSQPRKRIFGARRLQPLLAAADLKNTHGDAIEAFVKSFEAYLTDNVSMDKRCITLRAVECLSLLAKHAPVDYLCRIVKDLGSRLEASVPDYVMSIDTWTFSPEEMAAELADRSFLNILASREGGLNVGRNRTTVDPIYEANLGVFETLASLSD